MGIGGFFKGLGKGLLKVAPIAASFIPGVGPLASMAIGAAAGAGSGAVSGGGKGALLGGLLGAVPGAGKMAAAKVAGPGGAGNFLSNMISGATGNMPTAGGTGSKLGGFIDGLLNPNTLEAVGRGAGAISQTQATNRGVALDAMMQADQNRILADQDRRASETDLMKKLQQTNYIKNGGMPERKPMLASNGKPIPMFASGLRKLNDDDKAMATTLEAQLMDRLKNPPKLHDYDSKMNPGTAESILNWVGPAASGAGAIMQGLHRPTATQAPSIDPMLKYRTPPTVAGVAPFTKPPTAQFPPVDPFGTDDSNR